MDWIKLLVLLCLVLSVKSKFKAKVLQFKTCDLPPEKWDPDNAMTTTVILKKMSRETTKVSVIYNVTKTFGPIQMGTRSFHLQTSGVKELVYKIEHVDCRSVLATKLIALTHLNFDKKCYLQKGVYKMLDFDINNLDYIFKKTVSLSGRYYYEIEYYHANKLISCVIVIVDIHL